METTSAAKAEQPWLFKMVAPLEPGIVVIDMDRMLKFYTEVLGLKLVADAQTAPEMSTKFRATPHGYRIVRLQTPYGERIKLAQPKVPPVQNPVPEWVYERQGIAYFTFIVDDMTAMVTRLKANDVKLSARSRSRSAKGCLPSSCWTRKGTTWNS